MLFDPLDPLRLKLGSLSELSFYVIGPMRGIPEHNYPAFHAVTEMLRKRGYKVMNPAENFGGDQTRETHGYMDKNLRMVLDTKAVVVLPGWRDSELGRVEASMAKALNHPFYQAVLDGDPGSSTSWKVHPMETPATVSAEGPDAEARSLVFGDRNASYGNPAHDFSCTGRKWAATLSAHIGITIDDIPPEIVAVMMVDLKTSRLGHNPRHRDSRVDAIGYVLCLDRIINDIISREKD